MIPIDTPRSPKPNKNGAHIKVLDAVAPGVAFTGMPFEHLEYTHIGPVPQPTEPEIALSG